MVQPARNSKQNIAEGGMASGTSKKTELKLVDAARDSLEDLLLDFNDFLGPKRLPLWGKEHPKAQSELEEMKYTEDDLLPLSALQHLLFCRRQCVLLHIEQKWRENGTYAHWFRRDAAPVECKTVRS